MLQLIEKGGKQHAMPCHHAAAEALHAYIAAAGIAEDKKGLMFRTAKGHHGTALADKPMDQADAWRMVRRRALAAGIMAPIGNHSFARPGSRPISPMAERLNMHKSWPRMKARARPSSMIARRNVSRRTK